jgi:hypothetical protein
MPRNFDLTSLVRGVDRRNPRFWLLAGISVLALANAVLLFLYFAPPGGTRQDLLEESQQTRRQIAFTRAGSARLRSVSAKVQLGSEQAVDFQSKYFLPKRVAYDQVISEIQRMAKESGAQPREGVFSEEPVEGSPDLSILNVTSSYQGSYDNLMRFLYQADKSPMLLMLDTLQAAPQQRGQQINASIRFEAIIREEAPAGAGGQP